MKLLFRRKADGYLMRPIQTLATCVRLRHIHSGLECMADTAHLPANFDVLTHDIERGDVLRDISDGRLWIVEYVGFYCIRMQTRKDGGTGNMVKSVAYFGLVNYERVGRKYCLRNRQPHERVEFRKSQPAYATYDASKVTDPIRNATREIINRFDAVTNAQRHAKEYGVGFIKVEPNGNMTAIDPRSVILKWRNHP